jgi:hypothetical protein
MLSYRKQSRNIRLALKAQAASSISSHLISSLTTLP